MCRFVCFFFCSFIHCTRNRFFLIPTQLQLQTGIQVTVFIISLCFFVCLFGYLSVCMLLHPLHQQHVSSNPNSSSTSDRHSSKLLYYISLFLYLSVYFFVCFFVYLSYCPFVCFFVYSFIHCTGNMFLLILTQIQLQTGIQVSYCIISLCFCICLFVYFSICLLINPLHGTYVFS
jgi:hypothetical protein